MCRLIAVHQWLIGNTHILIHLLIIPQQLFAPAALQQYTVHAPQIQFTTLYRTILHASCIVNTISCWVRIDLILPTKYNSICRQCCSNCCTCQQYILDSNHMSTVQQWMYTETKLRVVSIWWLLGRCFVLNS